MEPKTGGLSKTIAKKANRVARGNGLRAALFGGDDGRGLWDALGECRRYLLAFVKWTAVGLLSGAAAGIAGAAFHWCIDEVTELRAGEPWVIWLLPVGGVSIALLYRLGKTVGANEVLEAERGDTPLPWLTAPLVFAATVLTQLVGGSAGKEGAAIQMGGTLGARIGRLLRLKREDHRVAVMAGVAAMFASVFGVPVTAAVFALEVASVGSMCYAALAPCAVASLAAVYVANGLGVKPMDFEPVAFGALSPANACAVLAVACCCALVSIAFCRALHQGVRWAARTVKDTAWRAAAGGTVLLAMTLLCGTQSYNGTGLALVYRAVNEGEAGALSFLMKLLFTVVTVSAGFRGGEIVPSLSIGAMLGVTIASLTGFDARFCAVIGVLSMFCAMVNCPLAAIVMGVELFGAQGIAYYALASAACYLLSGCEGLYHGQLILQSKCEAKAINIHAKA